MATITTTVLAMNVILLLSAQEVMAARGITANVVVKETMAAVTIIHVAAIKSTIHGNVVVKTVATGAKVSTAASVEMMLR